MTSRDIIERTIDREGGYVNDPHDPGGETKYGLSKRQHPHLDIASLTRARAHEIYLTEYYAPSGASRVPAPIREVYFDMVVHMGQRRAIKVLQEAARDGGADIRVDGILGPRTLAAAKDIEPWRLRGARVKFYAKLVLRRPDRYDRYWYGWVRRAMEC